MRRFIRGILLIITTGFMLVGCQQNEQHVELEDAMPIVTFQMVPSSEGVEDFLTLLNGYRGDYDDDRCYNVTPEDIADDYGFNIFKFDKSCSSFLLYDDKVYPLGEWLGGYGVTSFAVSDLNGDGKFELYFTYSWGSGIPRSQVGYFDTANKEVVLFDFSIWFQEWILSTDSDNVLCVYDADWQVNTYVDIKMSAKNKVASIVADGEKITLAEE